MPISRYYSGRGEEVMSNMKKRYGEKGGERVFYATANKRDQKGRKSKRGRSKSFGFGK